MADKIYNKNYFKFNLIPPKSQEEVSQLVERDNTLFYSFLLIVFGMFLFFVISIIKVAFIDPILSQVDSNLETVQSQISNFDEIRRINGELYIKANALDPILDRDVEVTKVLDLESRISQTFPNLIDVEDYSRRGDGSFALTFLIEDSKEVTKITEYMRAQSEVSSVKLLSSQWTSSANTTALINISFFLSNIQI